MQISMLFKLDWCNQKKVVFFISCGFKKIYWSNMAETETHSGLYIWAYQMVSNTIYMQDGVWLFNSLKKMTVKNYILLGWFDLPNFLPKGLDYIN